MRSLVIRAIWREESRSAAISLTVLGSEHFVHDDFHPCFCDDMERPAKTGKRLCSLRKRHDPSLSSLLEVRLLAGAARAADVEVERETQPHHSGVRRKSSEFELWLYARYDRRSHYAHSHESKTHGHYPRAC